MGEVLSKILRNEHDVIWSFKGNMYIANAIWYETSECDYENFYLFMAHFPKITLCDTPF